MFPDLSLPCDRWTGWYRPNGRQRWQLLAQGADEQECREQLAYAPRGGDYLVLAPGYGDPNDRRV